jgi:hypothetical protein
MPNNDSNSPNNAPPAPPRDLKPQDGQQPTPNPSIALVDTPEARPAPPLTKARINSQGLIELVNLHTGEVLCVQRDPNDDWLTKRFDNLVAIDTPQGRVWIEKTLDPSRVFLSKKQKIAYSQFWADLIANNMINDNMTFIKASEALGLPFSTVAEWRRRYPEFATILENAKKDQAEKYADEAITTARDLANQPNSKDKTPAASLKVKTLQWAAEKADPNQYGQRVNIQADVKQTVHVRLETGIRRPGDPGFVEPQEIDITPPQAREALGMGDTHNTEALSAGGDDALICTEENRPPKGLPFQAGQEPPGSQARAREEGASPGETKRSEALESKTPAQGPIASPKTEATSQPGRAPQDSPDRLSATEGLLQRSESSEDWLRGTETDHDDEPKR